MNLSAAELRELLSYDPKTGLFVWRKTRGGTASKGSIAGADNGDGYVTIMVRKRAILAHRLAVLYMTGQEPKETVDHINGDVSDNRWVNLRCVSHRENMKNQRLRSSNKSGVLGVSWNKSRRKWCAKIEDKHIGLYEEFSDAVVARKQAEADRGYHPNHGRRV